MSFEQFQRFDYEKSALAFGGIKMEKCLFGEDEIEVPEILLEDVSKHNFYETKKIFLSELIWAGEIGIL